MVLSFRLIEGGGALNACARTGAQPGGRYLLEAADGLGDKLMPLWLGHALQAMGDGEGSVPECAVRGHSRDPGFLARQSMALQIRG